jgi:hypothetical protein
MAQKRRTEEVHRRGSQKRSTEHMPSLYSNRRMSRDKIDDEHRSYGKLIMRSKSSMAQKRCTGEAHRRGAQKRRTEEAEAHRRGAHNICLHYTQIEGFFNTKLMMRINPEENR